MEIFNLKRQKNQGSQKTNDFCYHQTPVLNIGKTYLSFSKL